MRTKIWLAQNFEWYTKSATHYLTKYVLRKLSHFSCCKCINIELKIARRWLYRNRETLKLLQSKHK